MTEPSDAEIMAYWDAIPEIPPLAPFIYVQSCQALLARYVPTDDSGSMRMQVAKPQPPMGLLEDALWEQGGAINMSGNYPITRKIKRWIRRNRPTWE
jgi:hypothetical protein